MDCLLQHSKQIEFTPRELQIMQGLIKGLTNKEIGKLCIMQPETVKTHLRNMFEKTGNHTRAGLVAYVLNTEKTAESRLCGTCILNSHSCPLLSADLQSQIKKA